MHKCRVFWTVVEKNIFIQKRRNVELYFSGSLTHEYLKLVVNKLLKWIIFFYSFMYLG
jgi:hypothetical protein